MGKETKQCSSLSMRMLPPLSGITSADATERMQIFNYKRLIFIKEKIRGGIFLRKMIYSENAEELFSGVGI